MHDQWSGWGKTNTHNRAQIGKLISFLALRHLQGAQLGGRVCTDTNALGWMCTMLCLPRSGCVTTTHIVSMITCCCRRNRDALWPSLTNSKHKQSHSNIRCQDIRTCSSSVCSIYFVYVYIFYVYIYVYHVCLSLSIHTCIYVYMYIYMWIYVYVEVCIHT